MDNDKQIAPDDIQTEITIPIKLKGENAWTQKLTVKKKKQALQFLLDNGYNMSKAAASIGVTRMALVNCMNTDDGFRKAVEQIKDVHLDQLEEASFIVASQPSREGFQDRKLQLQSHRRETYGDKVQIDQTVKINQTTAVIHIDAVLGSVPTIDPETSLTKGHTSALPETTEQPQAIEYTEVKK